MNKKSKSIIVRVRKTGETWLCENWNQRRVIDDIEFVEVYKPENGRRLLMNVSQLEKVKLKNI